MLRNKIWSNRYFQTDLWKWSAWSLRTGSCQFVYRKESTHFQCLWTEANQYTICIITDLRKIKENHHQRHHHSSPPAGRIPGGHWGSAWSPSHCGPLQSQCMASVTHRWKLTGTARCGSYNPLSLHTYWERPRWRCGSGQIQSAAALHLCCWSWRCFGGQSFVCWSWEPQTWWVAEMEMNRRGRSGEVKSLRGVSV